MLYRSPDLFGAGHGNDMLTPVLACLVDAAQRQVLFMDTMRQRGNQYYRNIAPRRCRMC